MPKNPSSAAAKALTGLVAAIAMSACASAAADAQQLPEKTKFGLLVSRTGPGVAAAYAFEVGSTIAVNEINTAGGLLGKQIQLVPADDQTDPSNAVTEAKRLVFNGRPM